MTKSTLDQDHWIEEFKKSGLEFFKFFDDVRVALFFNPCNHKSMRITAVGYRYLKTLKLVEYSIKTKSSMMPRDLLLLERHFTSPYFIKNLNNLIVFDESTATMLYLLDGDLQTYLDNLKQQS